jgi:nicotinamidase-related amidase
MKESFALLIIDVQEGLFSQKTGIYNEEVLTGNINKLLKFTRNTKNYPMFIRHNNKGFLKKSSPGWELYKKINFKKGDILIEKEHGNAFQKTVLKDELKKINIDKVIICGLVSHGCVKATCLGAVENEFKTVLVSDGHSSYSKQAEKIITEVNKEMSRIIEVKSAEEIISG